MADSAATAKSSKKIQFEEAENPILLGGKSLPYFVWKYLFHYFGYQDFLVLNKLKATCKFFYKIIKKDEELELRSKYFSFDDLEHSSKNIVFSEKNRKLGGKVGVTWYNFQKKTFFKI